MKPSGPGRDLVHALLFSVRLFAEAHTLALCPGPEVRRLVGLGLLSVQEVVARPMLPLDRPLFSWRPGDPAPDSPRLASRLAWLCEERWRGPFTKTLVYTASETARRIYGGYTPPELNTDQVSHDLHCGALYVKACLQFPELAPYWLGEDLRKRDLEAFEKLPDIVFGTKYYFSIKWEFMGLYPAKKIAALIEQLVERGLAFVLW